MSIEDGLLNWKMTFPLKLGENVLDLFTAVTTILNSLFAKRLEINNWRFAMKKKEN